MGDVPGKNRSEDFSGDCFEMQAYIWKQLYTYWRNAVKV